MWKDEKNWKLFHSEIHRLRGASCYCNIPNITDLLAKIENKISLTAPKQCPNLKKNLEQDLEQFNQWCETVLVL